MKLKPVLLIIFFFVCFTSANAQSFSKENSKYQKTPLWIDMMDDTLTNYFEAQLAFSSYWKERQKPIEEDAILGNTQMKKESRSNWIMGLFSLKAQRKEQESETLSFEYKKFKNWERAMQPYVQDDGSILFPSQRLAIWQQFQSTK